MNFVSKSPLIKRRTTLLALSISITLLILVLAISGYFYFKSRWEQNWLAGVPCHAPCWQGITPGKTTFTELVQLIENNPKIEKINYYEPGNRSYNEITWDSLTQNNSFGRVVYDLSSTIVIEVGLAFPYTFTLGEVVAVYGEPSHVLAIAGRNMENPKEIDYRLTFFWQSQGLELLWGEPYPSHTPKIDPNLIFHSIGFFEPTTQGFERFIALRNKAQIPFLEPWKGYADFEKYCHVANFGGGIDQEVCRILQ
jgi:hypothetical protein